MKTGVTTASPPDLIDLGSFEIDAERPNRKVIVQQSSLKVVQLTLAPGQELPPHRHPGCYVLLQGLWGTTTVLLEGEEVPLVPQHLLNFSGDNLASLRNNGSAPSALLITLAKHDEKRDDEDPSFTPNPRVS